jgi:N6-adenosine-specific RNA methylase IME4
VKPRSIIPHRGTLVKGLYGPASHVFVDPAWHYSNRWITRKNGEGKNTFGPGAAGRYPVMKTEEIAALPIGDLGAADSLCLLWTTGPYLATGEAADVMRAWGWTPKTMLYVWIKTNRARWESARHAVETAHAQPPLPGYDPLAWLLEQQTQDDLTFAGTGNYTFSNAEFVLVGRRGDMLPRAIDPETNKQRIAKQVIYAPVGEHSSKPQQAYDRTDLMWPPELYPNRVDVFGRETPRPGWYGIGNQAPETAGEDIRDTIRRITESWV